VLLVDDAKEDRSNSICTNFTGLNEIENKKTYLIIISVCWYVDPIDKRAAENLHPQIHLPRSHAVHAVVLCTLLSAHSAAAAEEKANNS
jgi:hypothetical protein